MKSVLLSCWIVLAHAAALAGQQEPSLPYQPTALVGAKGHEWYLDANGALQRHGTSPTLMSNSMSLHVGGQPFFCQQPLVSADGLEMLMNAAQPLQGVEISRRISFQPQQGRLRYVETLTNRSGRDITLSVELRHSLNSGASSLRSDRGRLLEDALESAESGFIGLPGESDALAPAMLFTIRAPHSPVPVRLVARVRQPIAVIYTLTLSPGQTQTLIHGISQFQVASANDEKSLAKACASMAMASLIHDLPASSRRTAANLVSESFIYGSAEIFPTTFWEVPASSTDQLALGKDSLLKGQAAFTTLPFQRGKGEWKLQRDELAALAGPAWTSADSFWVWRRDGQRWKGRCDLQDLRFTLLQGGELTQAQLDRLIFAKSPSALTTLTHPIIECWNGERIAIVPDKDWMGRTAFGTITLALSDIVAWKSQEEETLGGRLALCDGSRLRLQWEPQRLTLRTVSLGDLEIDSSQIRHLHTPHAAELKDEAGEPTAGFLDLSGDQRLVGKITSETVTFVTETGLVSLSPTRLRELSVLTVDSTPSPRFQGQLWGGGQVTGGLLETHLHVEGRGFAWDIPVRHLRRLSHPIPHIDSSLMRRLGSLLKDLSSPEWKVRESASQALRELGTLAHGSMREALQSTTDAEVIRRLEELLQSED